MNYYYYYWRQLLALIGGGQTSTRGADIGPSLPQQHSRSTPPRVPGQMPEPWFETGVKPLLPRVSSHGAVYSGHRRSLSATNMARSSFSNLKNLHTIPGVATSQAHTVSMQQSRKILHKIILLLGMIMFMLVFLHFVRQEELDHFVQGPLQDVTGYWGQILRDESKPLDSVKSISSNVDSILLSNSEYDGSQHDLWVMEKYRAYDAEKMDGMWRKTKSLRIPPIIHVIYGKIDVGGERAELYVSLHEVHPGWEIRFHDMGMASHYVREWFPAYVSDFEALENQEEKENVFRYLVVYKFGGILYTGKGELNSPDFGAILSVNDSFVAVWNNGHMSASAALNSCRVRQRGLRHDIFAAVPNHPILMDIFSRILLLKGRIFSHIDTLNALEKTGEGVFTDTVLSYALDESIEEKIRLLPSVLFRQNAKSAKCDMPWMHIQEKHDTQVQYNQIPYDTHNNEMTSDHSKLEISDWFSQASKTKSEQDSLVSETLAMVERIAQKEATHKLLPVSCYSNPPFDVMTHVAGSGEWHSGSDVSVALMSYGTWQPSVEPHRGPTIDTLILSAMKESGGYLIDVGAGYGLTSLAAASQGHKVIAFEVGTRSLTAFKASISRNQFKDLISIKTFPLGSESQDGISACLRASGNDISIDSDWHRAQQRGYGLPQSHDFTGEKCLIQSKRRSGAKVLGNEYPISALKVSAEGWGGFVVEGFLPVLQKMEKRPKIIMLEWNPRCYKDIGYSDPIKILEKLHDLGYHGISHSGYICDERWHALTYNIKKRGRMGEEDTLIQPTWCRLDREDFRLLLKIGELSKTVETLLFLDVDKI